MKRWTWLLLLATAIAPGCVLTGTDKIAIVEPEVPPVDLNDLAPPPEVTPEQVNENNAREMFQRMSDEVDRARNALPPGQR
jgi:hypothetical protein